MNTARPRRPAGSFVSVSAGSYHTCGVRSNGSAACWGNNRVGQATPHAGSFVSVSAGGATTCGVRSNGSVVCWGSDSFGQATPPRGFLRLIQRRGVPQLRGEEQRLRRLLGQR